MQKLHFSIQINAPAEKVWNTMLDDQTYRIWTDAFNPGANSFYEGSWEKGSKIKFLGSNPDGTHSGMSSVIAENKPHEFISIEHVGIIMNDKEDTESVMAKGWSGALENYTFKPTDTGTEIVVDIDVDEDMIEDFQTMWPKGLTRLKELVETGK